jgi:hypothetical protein
VRALQKGLIHAVEPIKNKIQLFNILIIFTNAEYILFSPKICLSLYESPIALVDFEEFHVYDVKKQHLLTLSVRYLTY